ncbi:MAG: ABC transporter substrate-binding protein [Opitutales bacterium]
MYLRSNKRFQRPLWFSLISFCAAVLTGCGEKELYDEEGRFNLIVQMDWYAQPEHGGFYHALANGYYEEAGLNVKIQQGVQNARTVENVVVNRVQFSIGSSDGILQAIARDLPLLVVGAQMQHDPQGIMVHEESGIDDFADLDGKTVMAGAEAPFLLAMESAYNIQVATTPLDGGMARFLLNKNFAQQCFVTSEPYYVVKEGAKPKVLWLAEIDGYDPYRVVYTNREFAAAHPEIVKAFMEATIRGWRDYLAGDREKAEALIAQQNVKMADPDYRTFAFEKMKEYRIVEGFAERGEDIGVLKPERIQRSIDRLIRDDLIARELTVDEVMTTEFLPEKARRLSEAGDGVTATVY